MRNEKAKAGDVIRIDRLDDPFDATYPGRIGTVEFIDPTGHLHGTWGSLAVIPESDEYTIIKHA